MYTGLVTEAGRVHAIDATPDGVRLTIGTPIAAELRAGDSVAVNGVCLTASAPGPDAFCADVMNETLRNTTLGGLKPGETVNLERSMLLDGRLDGHFVQGHVDGVGTVTSVRIDGPARVVTLRADPSVLRHITERGSVAVDGVSLTARRVGPRSFQVSLIPETQQRTTLGRATAGSRFNLEVDVLAKYVERLRQTAA